MRFDVSVVSFSSSDQRIKSDSSTGHTIASITHARWRKAAVMLTLRLNQLIALTLLISSTSARVARHRSISREQFAPILFLLAQRSAQNL
jgi:hypothetical protein